MWPCIINVGEERTNGWHKYRCLFTFSPKHVELKVNKHLYLCHPLVLSSPTKFTKFIFHFHPLPSNSLLLSVPLAHRPVLYAAVDRHSGHNPALHHKAVKCQQGPVTRPTLALLSLFYWWRVADCPVCDNIGSASISAVCYDLFVILYW